jgi:WD40 repeat protein
MVRNIFYVAISTLVVVVAAGAHPKATDNVSPRVSLVLQTGQTAEALSTAISPDGRFIASGNAHSISLWDRRRKSIVRHLQGHRDRVSSIVFSANGNQIASVDNKGELIVWDTLSGEVQSSRSTNKNPLSAVLFAESDQVILTAGWDNAVRIWDNAACANSCQLAITSSLPWTLAISPDGKWLAVGLNGKVEIWQLDWATRSAQHFRDLDLSADDSDRIAVAFANSDLVAVNSKGSVVMQRFSPWETVWRQETGLGLADVAFSKNKAAVFVAGAGAPMIGRTLCFAVTNGKRIPLPENGTGLVGRFRSIGLSEDGNWLVAGGQTPMIWNLSESSMPERLTLQMFLGQIAVLSPSADFAILPILGLHQFSLTAGSFKSFSMDPLFEGASLAMPLQSPSVSPDGRFILTSSINRQLVKAAIDRCGMTLNPEHSSCLAKLVPEFQTKSLYSLLLISTDDQKNYHDLGPIDGFSQAGFSNTSRAIFWRTPGGFDIDDPECLCKRRHFDLPMDDGSNLAISPDGDLLASLLRVSGQLSLQIYSTSKNQVVKTVKLEPGGSVRAFEFRPRLPRGAVQIAVSAT